MGSNPYWPPDRPGEQFPVYRTLLPQFDLRLEGFNFGSVSVKSGEFRFAFDVVVEEWGEGLCGAE
jgi:hypothetical protein